MEVFSPKDARKAIAEKIPCYVFDVFKTSHYKWIF